MALKTWILVQDGTVRNLPKTRAHENGQTPPRNWQQHDAPTQNTFFICSDYEVHMEASVLQILQVFDILTHTLKTHRNMRCYLDLIRLIYSGDGWMDSFRGGLTTFPEQRPRFFLLHKNFQQRIKINSTQCFREEEHCQSFTAQSAWNDICPKQIPFEPHQTTTNKASFADRCFALCAHIIGLLWISVCCRQLLKNS